MENETVQSATPQPAQTATVPEAKSGEPAKGNLSIAQAAQRLLNMEKEAARVIEEQTAPAKQAESPPPQTPEAAPAESAEPEAKSAEEAAPAAETTEETEGNDVPSHDITPELQKKIDKRIGKEVAKRKALEAQLNELKLAVAQQQAQQQPAPPPPIAPLPQGTVPLAQIEDVSGLVQLQQQAKEAKRFAEEQLDREDFEPVRVGENILDKAALKTIIRNANKTLEDDIPARYQFLQAKNQAQQVAYERFPFLKDKSAPEYVMAQQAYIAMPWLRNLPNADWIIGVQIEGLKALEAKEKSKAAKAPAKPAPTASSKPPAGQSIVSTGGSEPRTAASSREKNSLEAQRAHMSKKGGVTANEAAQFLLARELAKKTR